KLISVAEVAKHSKYNDAWVICNGKVFDVTKFISEHPGGENVLMEIAGTDCTENFEDVGHSLEARDIQMKYYVGDL
ncbi:cytochrome b5, partial [Ramicandelaber brevisporus]